MTIIDPTLLANSPIEVPKDVTIPDDPLARTARWQELQSIAVQRNLSAEECQEMVQLTRALRRTNTGPAKAKTSKAKAAKPVASLDDILGD